MVGRSKEVIDEFVKAGLIYEEDRYHNIVFKGNDKHGNTLFASMRVFLTEMERVSNAMWQAMFNVWNEESTEIAVFEAYELCRYL